MLTHDIENNPDSQRHLHENFDKFSGDTRTVLELMYKGIRLNSFMVVKEYNLDSRRLRDAIKARPDIVRKSWKHDENGKRLFVEYYINIPMPKGKLELIEWAGNLLDKQAQLKQGEIFT